MPYLPPEGFLPYPGSHLYYRAENGIDTQTGAPCRWVTYFDPNEGKYHQVSYPLAEQTPQAKPREPPPDPQPAPQPQSVTQSIAPSAPPPAAKKGHGKLVALLLTLALLLGGGFALWYTGAYTKLPFFSQEASISGPPSGQSDTPQSLPKKGTPQRGALLALSVLFGDEGMNNQFQGLEAQELRITASTYFSRAPEEIRAKLDALTLEIRRMADGLPVDAYDLILPLRNHAMGATLTTQMVEQGDDRAVVKITGTHRIDLDRVGDFLSGLDYGTPFNTYLQEHHSKTRSEVAEGYYMDGPFQFCLYYWANAVEEAGRDALSTDEPYSVELTMVRSESDGWLLESAPDDLSKLFFAYDTLPMDLEEPYQQAMSALSGAAEPIPTNGPSAGTVQSGDYTFDLPDFGRAVLLTLYPDNTFYLETALGGDGYYAMGTYRVEGKILLLTPEGDYYQEVMGDLSGAMFEIGTDGTLFLQAPANVGLMEQGQRLSLEATQKVEINELLLPLVEDDTVQAMREYAEQYPSQNAFPTGVYVRTDGNAVLIVDGSPSEDSLDYFLGAMPGPNSGSKAELYSSPGNDHGVSNLCMVSGRIGTDDMNGIELTVMDDGGIQVTSSWEEEQYIAYEAPDGLYYFYP